MMRHDIFVAAVLAAMLWHNSLVAQRVPPRIVVGPNRLVSQALQYPHAELMVESAPWDAKLLVGTSTLTTTAGHRQQLAVYSTTDGGRNWLARVIPDTFGDPQVATGSDGSLLFFGLGYNGGIVVARSADRGATWDVAPALGRAYDHPQVVVDHTAGHFGGRAYISVLYGRYTLGLFRSDDDGRTWQGPLRFEQSGDTATGFQTRNPLVLHDGTLVLPYSQFQPSDTVSERIPATVWLTTSIDGGLSFTQRWRVHDAYFTRAGKQAIFGSDPTFAVDTAARHRDRLYMAWADDSLQPWRIFIRFSDDRGATWKAPIFVDPDAPIGSRQREPTIAVNKDGVVGVRWFDSRHAPREKVNSEFFRDEYFAASLDGGMTFLPAVRVSTSSSGDSVAMAITGNRPDGGDYFGLTSDLNGTFWPFWPDTRTGVQHVFTAPIRVGGKGSKR